MLAEALGDRRDDAFVADKVWTPDAREGEAQAERALRLVSRPGRPLPGAQPRRTGASSSTLLERLRDEGKVGHASARRTTAPRAFGELAEVMRSGRIDAIQIPYNPHEREVEREILPLAAGARARRRRDAPARRRRARPPRARPRELAPLREFGVETWAQALLKWVLSDPRCTVAIPATSRPERLAENAAAGAPPWFGADERALVERLAG